jgi:pimeloyl-ACP methyl ester carboxylesterase
MAKKLISRAALVLVGCLTASSLFNLLYLHHLKAHYPVPGNFYKVNDRTMHLYCSGAGSPTVLIEPGIGNSWLDWQKVQPELAKTTRVCTYDRAGLGWSETQPGPRDAVNIASQLQQLLQQAGEPGPFVLLGASAGGFYIREFYARYPDQIVGIVFSDASIPEQIWAIPNREDTDAKRKQRHRTAMWQWIREASGWERIRGRCEATLGPGMEAYANFGRAESCRPAYSTTWLGEADGFSAAGEQAAQTHCCDQLPLLIISQDPDRPKPGWDAASIAANPIWNRLQENLKTLSPHSRRIIARGSGHHVMFDRPDVIIAATRQLVTEIRQNTYDPQNGTTVVQ